MATWISGGTIVYPKVTAFSGLNSTPLGLPLAVYVLLALTVLAQWILRGTTAGRQMYLVGDNPAAARAAGLPVGRVTVVAWASFGACIALTGVFLLVLGLGVTMIAGEFDLSVVGTYALGGMLAVQTGQSSAVLGMLGAVAAGAAIGTLQGGLIARLRIPSLPVTLATYIALLGLTSAMSGGLSKT